ncbi:FlxA-like family protein, partial [Streptomyces sp. NPDC058439]|uniref:FlxA-like family protein n=1 Tax=Streptomyces sp. NPDC058439 TaxID=3346500 RepID=UPI003665D419
MALVALVAAVGFILAGPATDASAAPTPPPPAAGSPENEPGLLFKLGWYAYGWAHHPLDRHDPYYQAKLPAKIFVQRVYKWMTEGKTSFSIKSDVPNTLDDGATWYRESRQTEKSLKKQLTKAEKDIQKRNKQVATAMTRDERAEAQQKRQASVKKSNRVSRELRELKETAPVNTDEQVKRLNEQARNLEKKVRELGRVANDPQQKKAKRAEAQQQIGVAQEALSQVQAERDRLRGDEGPDEAGGARPTKLGPKNPPKGPSAGGTNLPKGSVVSRIKPPKFGLKIPRWGRGQGTGMAEMFGDLAGQATAEYIDSEHEQLLKKALADDKLRKLIIDDYHQIKDDNSLETLIRAFDTSKGFTQGATRDIGPKLIEHQKVLDHTKAAAEKS